MIKKFINYFIPESFKNDEEDYRKASTLVWTLVVTYLFTMNYASTSFFIEYDMGMWTEFIGSFVYLGLLFLFKNTGNVKLVSNICVGCATICIAICAWFSGGYDSGVFQWLAFPAIVVMLISDQNSGWFWLVINVCIVLVFSILNLNGYAFPEEYNLEYKGIFEIICYVGLVVILFLIVLVFEKTKNRAFGLLEEKTKQVVAEKKRSDDLNATKDKFFGIIAHDIRSPIAALDGVGDQMNFYLKKNKPDKLQFLANHVGATAKHLNALLDNLLNWALLQQGVIPYHPKALDVKEVSKGIFDMFQKNADSKNIRLELQVKEGLKVYADESAFNTILRNLVSNAIKFTPNGGTVSLSSESNTPNVFINIKDTGTGLSNQKLAKIFSLEKKSERGTAGERGTGLGLNLVKELTDLNKGSIDIKSVLNQGSTFRIGLPIAL